MGPRVRLLVFLLALAAIPASFAQHTARATSAQNFEQIAQRADEARAAGNLAQAVRLYADGVRLRPAWRDGWWALGAAYYEQDRFAEAHAALTRFAALAPKPAAAWAFLGLCEYEMRDYAPAIEHFRKWALNGSPGTDALIDVASFHWALLLTRDGRFLEALYLLGTKAEKRGRRPALVEAMGLASLRIASLPEDYPAGQREEVWLAGEAAVQAQLHAWERADLYANRLLARYGEQPGVHYFRGTLFGFEKEPARAAAEFERELQISPQHAPAMIELAAIGLEDPRLADPLPLATRASELEPNNGRARHMLGRALLKTNRVPESIAEFEAAKQLAPDSAPVRLDLAKAFKAAGRSEDAERELAAFKTLKENAWTFASPEEKQKPLREQQERSK